MLQFIHWLLLDLGLKRFFAHFLIFLSTRVEIQFLMTMAIIIHTCGLTKLTFVIRFMSEWVLKKLRRIIGCWTGFSSHSSLAVSSSTFIIPNSTAFCSLDWFCISCSLLKYHQNRYNENSMWSSSSSSSSPPSSLAASLCNIFSTFLWVSWLQSSHVLQPPDLPDSLTLYACDLLPSVSVSSNEPDSNEDDSHGPDSEDPWGIQQHTQEPFVSPFTSH